MNNDVRMLRMHDPFWSNLFNTSIDVDIALKSHLNQFSAIALIVKMGHLVKATFSIFTLQIYFLYFSFIIPFNYTADGCNRTGINRQY